MRGSESKILIKTKNQKLKSLKIKFIGFRYFWVPSMNAVFKERNSELYSYKFLIYYILVN